MDAEITRATASDSAVIAQLLVDSWRFAYKGVMPDEHLAALSVEQRSKAWTKHLIAGGEAYLLKDDDGVAGIVEISRFRDVLAGFEHYGEIPVIYLKPEKIGVGYGRRLMQFAVAVLAARNLPNVGIWVLEKNARAIEFYRKQGFEFSGNTKVHSATGLVEWLMVRVAEEDTGNV